VSTASFAVRYFIHFEQGGDGCTDETGQIFDSDQEALTKRRSLQASWRMFGTASYA